MNDDNVTNQIQPQEPPTEESQSLQNTTSKIGQKENILIIAGLIVLMSVIGVGAYFLGVQKAGKEAILPSTTPSPTITSQLNPSPNQTGEVVKLYSAWSLGTKIYSNPTIGITFEYPSYFETKESDVQKANKEWADKYKNDPNVKQPLYRSNFSASFYTPDQELAVNQEFCDNNMSVSVQQYDNAQNLSLYDFIADLQRTFPGDGITETFDTFDTYKKGLKSTVVPKEGSYVFEGIVYENPVKTVYFTNKEKVYTFELIGNCDTGGKYTPDADKILQNMLNSVKYL